jgi:hypothetical protein
MGTPSTFLLDSGRRLVVFAVRNAAPLRLGLSVGGVILTVGLFAMAGSPGFDLYAYWNVNAADPYGSPQGFGAFHYSPAMAVAFLPLKLLPWPLAYWVWLGLMLGVLAWLGRRWTLAFLLFPPVVLELYEGNIHLLIAAALVLGLRRPAAWAFLLLTKITPGAAVLWFAVRRDGPALVATTAATAIIVGVSFIATPDAWRSWAAHLLVAEAVATPNQLPIPLLIRLPVAALVISWGALTDRAWTLAVGTTLALPVVWFHGLAVLAAVPALLDRRRGAPVGSLSPQGSAAATTR